MKNVLVTGATGFVGSNLVRELLAHGYRVRVLHRGQNLAVLKGQEVEMVQGDLSDLPLLESACKGIDGVFHIAALFRQAKFPDQVYWDVNFTGTKNLLEASEKQGVRRFIYCSTNGVHSHIVNPPANEDAPYNPSDVYQVTKCEAEKLVLQHFKEKRIDGCVIRPAMIWGPGDLRFLKFFKGIARRRLPIIGTGQSWTHWIFVQDLARAFRLAYESPSSSGKAYLIAGDRPVTMQYAMQTIADIFKVQLWPINIPAWPFQVIGSLVEAICRPLGIEPPIHRRRADFFIKNRAFDTTRARTDFDFRPQKTFEEEARLIANWYLENNLI